MFLVTGGAGFIGSHLVERLVKQGTSVRVFDNFSSGREANLSVVAGEVDVVHGDLRDERAVQQALAGIEVVFHQAAIPSVPNSVADPTTTFAVNVTGTLNLLVAARDAGCRRVVFASSCAVYGDTPEIPKTEEMLPSPTSPYAISKLTGEQLCSVFTHIYGLETVVLRYFNVFGRRQDPSSTYAAVVPRFFTALQAGTRPTIFGDGEQSRDFVHVDNIIDANLKAAAASAASGRVFNIATGQAVTVNQLLTMLADKLGTLPLALYESERPGDIRHSVASIDAARRNLEYEPVVSMDQGLSELVSAPYTLAPAD